LSASIDQAGARLKKIPRDGRFEAAPALLRDGYTFIGATCDALGTDVFETRLWLTPTICGRGRELAELLYDDRRFERRGALPRPVQRTLTGRDGVQSLDGDRHLRRKRMFMTLLAPERVAELAALAAAEWQSALQRWRAAERIVLFDESLVVLYRAVCRWSGVPLADQDVAGNARALAALIAGGGSIGPRYWHARRERRRLERWASELIEARRAADPSPDPSVVEIIARHRDTDGRWLPLPVAAVELLNVLRPTVAVAYLVTFAAAALERFPLCKRRLAAGGAAELECFVHEVRRYYPFFPFIAARVRADFEWRGYRFARGRRVLLDVYGTDRDPRHWPRANDFQPERFDGRDSTRDFAFVPQGGGDPRVTHRCAGEQATVELLKTAVAFLTQRLSYRVPPQDLDVDPCSLPALPADRVVIDNIRPRQRRGDARGGEGTRP
jgi:fatty-acid peroxygenase